MDSTGEQLHPLVVEAVRDEATLGNAQVMWRLVNWATWGLTWFTLGCVTGFLLDQVLWRVSYEYLYSPHEFTRSFARWSIVVAAILGATATAGTCPPARRVWLAKSVIHTVMLTVIVSVAWAMSLAEFSPAIETNGHLVPTRRARFCCGLCQGSIFGFGLGALLAGARIIVLRRIEDRKLP